MAADGALVFSVLTQKSDVWSLPINANAAEPLGTTERLTSGPANYRAPVVSQDGSRLAFISDRTGNEEVWVRDLKTGRDTALTAARVEKSAAVLSADGSTVAFGYSPPLNVFTVPFAGGQATQLCSACGQPRAWLPHEAGLLYQWISSSGESQIGLLDRPGHATTLVRSSESALFSPSVSPDGRWMALIVRTPPSDHRVMVIPLRDKTAAPRQEWISVTEPGSWVDKPRWSPDGRVLYYVSDSDGFVCIWARRLDPASKQPAAEPSAVVHFHNGRISLGNVYGLELSVAANKLVFNLGESSGNIWLAPASR
jgi:Tol biopolymer transport system component